MSDSAYIKTRPVKRPDSRAVKPADDYDDSVAPVQYAGYDQYAEDDQNEDYDGYYEDEYEGEEAVVSVNRNRALALAASFVILVGIFGVAILLLVNKQSPPIIDGPISGVPTLTGFNATTSSEDQAPTKGKLAPDFVWQEGGKTVSLSSFRGVKPVFVNFWGTWCPPCKAEMPEMRNFYNTATNDMEIIGVSMGPRDTPDLVLDFVNKTNYNWKFVHDGDYAVAGRYQVNSIPSSYFIDKNGVIQDVHIGAMTRSMMDNYAADVH